MRSRASRFVLLLFWARLEEVVSLFEEFSMKNKLVKYDDLVSIFDRSLLTKAGAEKGSVFKVRVEEGKVILTLAKKANKKRVPGRVEKMILTLDPEMQKAHAKVIKKYGPAFKKLAKQ